MTSFEISNTPIETYPVEQPQAEPVIAQPPVQAVAQQALAGETPIDLSRYGFYVEKANAITDYANREDPELFIDLDIIVSCENGQARVSKRIKMCKEHLAREAVMKDAITKATATYVESKNEKGPSPMTQRLLELAGIDHPLNYVKK